MSTENKKLIAFTVNKWVNPKIDTPVPYEPESNNMYFSEIKPFTLCNGSSGVIL